MNQIYSEKTDVWSFGITVIEILTRQNPYPEKSIVVVAEMVAKGNLKGEIPEWTSEEMKELLTKCFEHDPTQRISFKVFLFFFFCFF